MNAFDRLSNRLDTVEGKKNSELENRATEIK